MIQRISSRLSGKAFWEVVFISNPSEELKLANPSFRREAARGIYEGLIDYFSAFQGTAK